MTQDGALAISWGVGIFFGNIVGGVICHRELMENIAIAGTGSFLVMIAVLIMYKNPLDTTH